MSAFLSLTLKSSKKSTFLRKWVLGPRTQVWTDPKISNDMHVLRHLPFLRESLSARLLRKNLHSFPVPPFVPKTRGRGVRIPSPHPFQFTSWSCRLNSRQSSQAPPQIHVFSALLKSDSFGANKRGDRGFGLPVSKTAQMNERLKREH